MIQTLDPENCIEIIGAREHNLKNISLLIPRDQLVVITGVSGSGKSSLAFDTIYSEGQRRYLETFSAYIRQFIGGLERPDVDKVNGLSPVIAIDQKTTSKNPRSTVGTVTDIYDFFRLLYSKASIAYSYKTGNVMIKMSMNEILNKIATSFDNKRIAILAPIIKGRKGHYREELGKILKLGLKVRIDGKIQDIKAGMALDRYKVHDIEIVVDQLDVKKDDMTRLDSSLVLGLKYGKDSVMILDVEQNKTQWFCKALMDPESDLSYEEPAPNAFSFNSQYGSCKECGGLGIVSSLNMDVVITDPNKPIFKGGIEVLDDDRFFDFNKELKNFALANKINLSKPYNELADEHKDLILYGEKMELDDLLASSPKSFMELYQMILFKFKGLQSFMATAYKTANNKDSEFYEQHILRVNCPECKGARLKKESLHFKIDDKNISEVCNYDLSTLKEWLETVTERLNPKQQIIAADIIKEIKTRVDFLIEVGLDYLNLNRPSASLSGGEAQRIRLATQIGSQLTGVTYILDEPSIGLHQRDNVKLIASLKNLRDLGNSILVVEHDKDMMLASDYLIDIGPKAGIHGGEVINFGTPQEFIENGGVTADYLSNRRTIKIPENRRQPNFERTLKLIGATGHNLQNVTMEIPLGLFICITGVSGSGKSSLIRHTLYPILHKHVYGFNKQHLNYEKVEGLEFLDKVIEVDQSPIGRTPRSNPATYTGLFTLIRNLFAELMESKIRGYAPGRFSFNVKGGRCERCKGGGMEVIEMNFLPDVHVQCPDCRGKRYNRETLEIRYKGKSISDVLSMTIDEGLAFFEFHPQIAKKLQTLSDVGLGYVTIGQSSTTLSGGEAQRMKVATELSKKDTGKTIYILDEPTTGLHFQDIEKLLDVLNRLVGKGNTVLVIEHNLDVIKVADWLIDVGPEGGKLGGKIVEVGPPEKIAKNKESYTGFFLKEEL